MCFYMPTLCVHGPYYSVLPVQEKKRRGKLVNWVEKASFEKIWKLLEISKRERHHEVLLTLQNLNDLSLNLAPYSVPVIPRPLPIEIVEVEHYFTMDLLNLLPDSSSPSREPETEVVGRELVILALPGQPSFASENSGPALEASW